MHHLRRFRSSPATAIALLALFVAIGGTATAARNSNDNDAGAPTAQAGKVTYGSSPTVTAKTAKALGTKHLTIRSASTLIPGRPGTGYGSRAVEVRCKKGEYALSSGTNFSDDRDNLNQFTVYDRLTISPRGNPNGARARGARDSGGVGFTVYALCAG